jgi:hypothetical protein
MLLTTVLITSTSTNINGNRQGLLTERPGNSPADDATMQGLGTLPGASNLTVAIDPGGDTRNSWSACGNSSTPLAIGQGTGVSISIVLSRTTISRGDSVTYTVKVAGLGGSSPVPTGTVDVQVSINDGTWASFTTGEILIDGTFTSEWYTPSAMGKYNFQAVYSGDRNYPSSKSNISETLVVGLSPSFIETHLNTTSVKLGQSVIDNVTVNHLFETPTGSVDFQVSFDGGPFVTFDTKTLSGGNATSDPYIPSTTGTLYFRAIYGGDNNYNGSQSGDGDEPLIVRAMDKQEVTITAEVDLTIPAYSVSGTATVTSASGPVPTGTVTFESSYEGQPWFVYTSGILYEGRAYGNGYKYVIPGHYEFRAIYGGDDYYLSATSAEGHAPLDVPKVTSYTITDLSSNSITLGNSVSDSLFIGPIFRFASATGTIMFQVRFEDGPFETYDIQPLGNESASYTPSAIGHYDFRAVYSGDDNFLGSTSDEESLEVQMASIETTTCLGIENMSLGGSITDNVTVTGLVTGLCDGSQFPTGTVEFQVSFNCGGWITYDAGTVLVDGSARSVWSTPTAIGDYSFRAIYSGNGPYLGSNSCSPDEPLHVENPGMKCP